MYVFSNCCAMNETELAPHIFQDTFLGGGVGGGKRGGGKLVDWFVVVFVPW